jgi:hypothetical protein
MDINKEIDCQASECSGNAVEHVERREPAAPLDV